jgi:hemolysin type calcium-binding protein
MPDGRMYSTSARTLWFVALGGILAVFLFGATASQASAGCDHGSGSSAPDGLRGGSGPDCLRGRAGADFLAGGRGNDKLTGGGGADQLLAGPGRDSVRAGPGNDLVSAQDGVAERIDCGPGEDLASVDATDVVTGCEKVNLTAPYVEWIRFYTHVNAYGSNGFFQGGAGRCSPRSTQKSTCGGTAEEGTLPFNRGPISMEWDKRASGWTGQDVTIRATDRDSVLLGNTPPDWNWLEIDGGRVFDFVSPRYGVVRSGYDTSKVGEQGGPLRADLSSHSYLFEPSRNGYSLDLRGYLQIIRY